MVNTITLSGSVSTRKVIAKVMRKQLIGARSLDNLSTRRDLKSA
jgi:hypothetical protein